MPNSVTQPPSELLDYLPAEYRRDPFVGQFLLPFEKILLGRGDGLKKIKGEAIGMGDGATMTFNLRNYPVLTDPGTFQMSVGSTAVTASLGNDDTNQKSWVSFITVPANGAAITGDYTVIGGDGVLFPSVDAKFPPMGLEQAIADLASYLMPMPTPGDPNERQAPDEFLPWLASWTAFTLRADIPPPVQRQFLANIVQYYRRRGTLGNLAKLLTIFADFASSVTVEEPPDPDEQPHHFRVTATLRVTTPAVINRQLATIRDIIDLEKPAHTDYELVAYFPSMQVGVRSTVGIDTLLGSTTS